MNKVILCGNLTKDMEVKIYKGKTKKDNDNIYEELADVIIMICQFIHKNDIPHQNLLDKMCGKLIRYYETLSDKK